MQVDFAIITILEEELEAVLKHFPLDAQFYRGSSGQSYGMSRVQTKDGKECSVAIARTSDSGPQEAQQLASNMIRDLDPSLLLVVGIAGGVPDNDFTLGDVIVSSRIHDFGMNAYNPGRITWDSRGGIHPDVGEIVASLPMRNTLLTGWNTQASLGMTRPLLNKEIFKDFLLSQLTEEEKSEIFVGAPSTDWQQQILGSLKKHFGNAAFLSGQPAYKTRGIASSGSLIHDPKILLQWLQTARGVRAVEMEAGGVFQAARQLGKREYPVIAIRGISDIVGLKRDYEWTPYACQSAASFTRAFLSADSTMFDNTWRRKPAASVFSSIAPSTVEQTAPVSDDGSIKVYIIYAEEDTTHQEELRKHLALLRRRKIISTYSTHQVGAEGEHFEVDPDIDKAQLILLLVSPDFMASDLTYDYQMGRAMERRRSESNVRVIPILLRDVNIKETPIVELQALPHDRKPIAPRSEAERDKTWTEIATHIGKIAEGLQQSSEAES